MRALLGELSTLHSGRLNLLTESAVQEDLDLSGEQKELVKNFIKEQMEKLLSQSPFQREGFKGGSKPPPPDQDKRFLEMARAGEQAVSSILTVPQFQRLDQILLQVQLRAEPARLQRRECG